MKDRSLGLLVVGGGVAAAGALLWRRSRLSTRQAGGGECPRSRDGSCPYRRLAIDRSSSPIRSARTTMRSSTSGSISCSADAMHAIWSRPTRRRLRTAPRCSSCPTESRRSLPRRDRVVRRHDGHGEQRDHPTPERLGDVLHAPLGTRREARRARASGATARHHRRESDSTASTSSTCTSSYGAAERERAPSIPLPPSPPGRA